VRPFAGTWVSLALEKGVVRSSLKTSILVGTILVAINYGGAIVNGAIGSAELIKMVMTYAVPYCVSTFATVNAHCKINSTDKT